MTSGRPARALCAAALGCAVLAGCGGGRDTTTVTVVPPDTVSVAVPKSAPRRVAAAPGPLDARLVARLPAPVQDPATAVLGRRLVLMGGLTAADTSTTDVIRVPGGAAAPLPVAVHDAAAVRLGRRAYVFGGGGGTSTSDLIVAVGGGAPHSVGRLPRPLSDVSAAVVRGTAYVVGGYDGARPQRTILAWRPGLRVRVAAMLPEGVRYAAVTALGGRVLIAGGTDGTRSYRTIFSFDPSAGRVREVGSLPVALSHAAAGALGGQAYVLGGRVGTSGTQTASILRVDPQTGAIHRAGHLPRALSDAGIAQRGGELLLAGGRDDHGAAVGSVLALHPAKRTVLGAARVNRTPPHAPPGVYAHDGPGMLAPEARRAVFRVYVPNSTSNTVDVLDPRTGRRLEQFAVAREPQHVTPSYDERTLWVDSDLGNTLTPIDPRTGKPGKPVPVTDPYNLYFTPGGRWALVVAEREQRLDFRNPHTMKLAHSLPVPCPGLDHMDFTAGGTRALASCEYGSKMVLVDVRRRRVLASLPLGHGAAKPQDVKLSPDGRVFYVADMNRGGVWRISAARHPRVLGFTPTGAGAHGLYPSRDGRTLYVTNRGNGTISLLDFATGRAKGRWTLPTGASPDMGNVTNDGRTLWLSGRYSGVVYAIDTRTGHVRRSIRVGLGPHGLCVWPQPGRFSLGHTGEMR